MCVLIISRWITSMCIMVSQGRAIGEHTIIKIVTEIVAFGFA